MCDRTELREINFLIILGSLYDKTSGASLD